MAIRNPLTLIVDLVETRIAVRVAIAVAAVVILLSCLLGALLIRSYHQLSIHQTENNAYLISNTIKSSTKHAMMVNEPEHISEIINEINQQPEIGRVQLFNSAGEVVCSPDSETIGTVVGKDIAACACCHSSKTPLKKLPESSRFQIFDDPGLGSSVSVVNPIYNAPACSSVDCHPPLAEQSVLGVLEVTHSLGGTEANLARNMKYALWLLMFAIIGIALVIWISLRYFLARPVRSLLRATEAVAKGDLTYRLKGQHRDELGRLAASFNEMTASLQDAKVQIYRSNKLASLGRLAAGVAHEINNPLTGVLSFSSFLLKRAPEGSEEQEDLQTVVNETKRCRTIVRGLLDFSRQVQPKKTRACVNTAVRRAHDIVRNQLKVQQVHITLDLMEDLPEVFADGDQLVQLALNLVVNASDALKDQDDKQVRISTRLVVDDDRSFVEMKISDNGMGIPEENLDKIFDPFFSTKGNAGTGLGLSVVWGIIDEHGGNIRVDSKLGEGTSFVILIPVYETPLVVKKDEAS